MDQVDFIEVFGPSGFLKLYRESNQHTRQDSGDQTKARLKLAAAPFSVRTADDMSPASPGIDSITICHMSYGFDTRSCGLVLCREPDQETAGSESPNILRSLSRTLCKTRGF